MVFIEYKMPSFEIPADIFTRFELPVPQDNGKVTF